MFFTGQYDADDRERELEAKNSPDTNLDEFLAIVLKVHLKPLLEIASNADLNENLRVNCEEFPRKESNAEANLISRRKFNFIFAIDR